MVRRNVKKTKEYFASTLKRPLRRIRAWSDNGEFECTGFIRGLAVIEKEEEVDIWWNMKQSQHGKGSADGYGHHDKSTQRSGVMGHELVFKESEEHVVTAAKYMEGKDKQFRLESYNKAKKQRRKLRRMKYVAVIEDLDHFKSGDIVHTLDGISQLNSFIFCNRDGSVLKRYLTCNCAHCCAGLWSQCELKYAFGEAQRFEFVDVTADELLARQVKKRGRKAKRNNKENVVTQPASKRRRLNADEPLCVVNLQNAGTEIPAIRAHRGGFFK